eukprot:gene18296-20119_t
MEDFDNLLERINSTYNGRAKVYSAQSYRSIADHYANTVMKLPITNQDVLRDNVAAFDDNCHSTLGHDSDSKQCNESDDANEFCDFRHDDECNNLRKTNDINNSANKKERYITECVVFHTTKDRNVHNEKAYSLVKEDDILRRYLPVVSTAQNHHLPFCKPQNYQTKIFIRPRQENVSVNCEVENKKERIQQAILDGMAKYAEQKFGRKRQAPKASKARNAMDDYEIYLRSVKAKIKTCQDKINVVVKQKREIDEKLKKAEEEKEKQEKILQDAEDEKDAAEVEGRDPKLPSGFIVPQTAKKAAAGSGFANLVMKASAQLWEDKFMAMRAKKGGSDGQPEWMNKTKSRSDKVLVNVGKKPGHKKEEEQKPAWGANLKKAEPRRKIGEPKNDDGSQPAFAKVGLRKTQKKEEDDEQGSRKINFKEQMVKKAGGGSSRRRRGGDDSD